MNTDRGVGVHDEDDGGYADEKLVPGWRVGADDQIVLAGLLIVLLLFLGTGWRMFFGGDDDDNLVAAAIDENQDEAADATTDSVDDGNASAVVVTPTTEAEEVTTTTVAEETATTADAIDDAVGDVQAAVDVFPGDITGVANGTTAVLTGYVANQGESDEAEDAAGAVAGITDVDNQLELLEPPVLSALTDAGVVGATAEGVGTEIAVAGTIASEDDRQPTLDAAAAVPGVSAVKDATLNVSVASDLNALPQVQFNTGSADILEVSHTDLDAAAEILMAAGDDIAIEIQGYTDVRGSDELNLQLSQDRTEAVQSYLVAAGVNPDVLTAKGYGETEQFAAGETAEALAANRVVRFSQTS